MLDTSAGARNRRNQKRSGYQTAVSSGKAGVQMPIRGQRMARIGPEQGAENTRMCFH